MIPSKTLLFGAILVSCAFAFSCSKASSEVTFIGSTPGDDPIKLVLGIPAETKVDFIRWDLSLNSNGNYFSLKVAYGESQPNTLGFKKEDKRSFTGTYKVTQGFGGIKGNVYRLTGGDLSADLSLVSLNDNLLHILTRLNTLMIGNGGWSYTLNRKEPIPSSQLPVLVADAYRANETAHQLIFDGRTPCREIAADHKEMNASASCFKLKWRLILNRDPVSHLPTTYAIRKIVDNVPRDVSGKWTIINGTTDNPDVVIYQIDPDKPDESISFVLGDENVLFFLDKMNRLYVGNGDFSFTLNKKR